MKPTSRYSNKEWVNLLKSPADNGVLAQLRFILVRNLKIVFVRNVTRDLEQFVEDTVQDGLVKILTHIETFRADSQFLTWAQSVAVNEGISKLRRKHWKNVYFSDYYSDKTGRNGEDKNVLISPASMDPDPEEITINRMYLETIEKIIQDELTDKQRTALVYSKIYGLSPSMIARISNTSSNCIYKRIFDARKKIKCSLQKNNIEFY